MRRRARAHNVVSARLGSRSGSQRRQLLHAAVPAAGRLRAKGAWPPHFNRDACRQRGRLWQVHHARQLVHGRRAARRCPAARGKGAHRCCGGIARRAWRPHRHNDEGLWDVRHRAGWQRSGAGAAAGSSAKELVTAQHMQREARNICHACQPARAVAHVRSAWERPSESRACKPAPHCTSKRSEQQAPRDAAAWCAALHCFFILPACAACASVFGGRLLLGMHALVTCRMSGTQLTPWYSFGKSKHRTHDRQASSPKPNLNVFEAVSAAAPGRVAGQDCDSIQHRLHGFAPSRNDILTGFSMSMYGETGASACSLCGLQTRAVHARCVSTCDSQALHCTQYGACIHKAC